MKIQELTNLLTEKEFKEEKQDTGVEYTLVDGNVKLICYVEPNVEIEFISLYRWNNNQVKGTHNISTQDFSFTKDTIPTLFRKTKNNMPKQIGESINTHKEIDALIDRLF